MKTLVVHKNSPLASPVAAALAALGCELAVDTREADAVLILDSASDIVIPSGLRVVVVSNTNAYRTAAVFQKRSTHAPSLAMITEESPIDEAGDAARFEAAYRDIGATIVRLPPLYGTSGDLVAELLAPMDAKRRAILLSPDYANWKCTLAHIENAAHALALCLTHDAARGEIFNLGEPRTPTVGERAHQIARLAKYRGPILALPRDRVPPHLQDSAVDFRQDLIVSSDKIRRTLGYAEPVDVEEALRRTIALHRGNPHAYAPPPEHVAVEDALLKSFGL